MKRISGEVLTAAIGLASGVAVGDALVDINYILTDGVKAILKK